MASAINRAKHIFVALLKILAATYRITLSLNRDSSDDDVRAAFKKVSRKVHPDKGGSGADQTRLTVARPRVQFHASPLRKFLEPQKLPRNVFREVLIPTEDGQVEKKKRGGTERVTSIKTGRERER